MFWLWPPFDVFQLTHQQGFYASDVVYCALLLLLALRVVERPDSAGSASSGSSLGLAFWQTAQIVPVAAADRRLDDRGSARPACGTLWLAVLLAVLGTLPWIVWNAGHGWESLDMPAYGDKVHEPSAARHRRSCR